MMCWCRVACLLVWACRGVRSLAPVVVGVGRRCPGSRGSALRSSPNEAAVDESEWLTTRRAVSALASIGVAETAYLTYGKVMSPGKALCASQACSTVLEGPYSSVGGVPLAVFGLVAYGSVLGLAAWPLLGSTEGERALAEARSRLPLVVVTSAMAAVSSCLAPGARAAGALTCLLPS